MDVAGAMTPEECMEELQLDRIRDKPWHITYATFIYKYIYYFSHFLILTNYFMIVLAML